MNHTPGPWIYSYTQVGDEHGRHICDVYLTDEGEHSRDANGRLIEVAPEAMLVCKLLAESGRLTKGDENEFSRSWNVLAEATSLAREVIEKFDNLKNS